VDELEELIKQAVLIQENHAKGNHVVKLGSTVTVHLKGKEEIFTVVGEWEADPKQKKISHESPLGKALLGKRIGEKVEVEAPAGTITYTIVSVN
jgi:transcription elongation factor GreA